MGEQLDIFKDQPEVTQLRYLEDVPNYKQQFQKYELAQYVKELATAGKLRTPWQADAEMLVSSINATYGEKTATFVVTKNFRNESAYLVKVHTPTHEEFADILDAQGNLLPHRTSAAA